MTPDIVMKLNVEIDSGIKTEPQVVYLLAGIRKLIEQNSQLARFEYLKFHSDWVLHFKLKGPFAQKVLKRLEPAHLEGLRGGRPSSVAEADRLTRMDPFKEELSEFSVQVGLHDFSKDPNDWTRFLYLYSCVVTDCPLYVRGDNPTLLQEVVVTAEMSPTQEWGEKVFKVSWNITDKNGKAGTIFTLNTFKAEQRIS